MALVSHCGECDMTMCKKCQGIHEKLKTTKPHQVSPLTELLAAMKTPYKNGMKVLNVTKIALDKYTKDVTDALNTIDKEEQDQIKQADQHIAVVVKKITAHIHEKIKLANGNNKDILRKRKLENEKIIKSVKSKIEFVSGIIQNNDLPTLQVMTSELEGILDEVKSLSKHQPLESELLRSPVTLKFGECAPDALVEVVVVERKVSPGGRQSVQPGSERVERAGTETQGQDYSRMTTLTYWKVGTVKQQSTVYGLRLISGQLYACGDGGIHVYDTDLKLMKRINSDKLWLVTGVAQCGVTGDLIVACGYIGKGVHQLTPEGGHIACIRPGSWFSDVCCQQGRVYALEYGAGKIWVYEKRGEDPVWREAVGEHIKLQGFTRGYFMDKMVVTDDSIYVSSWNNHCIHLYSMSGAHLRQLGRWGRSAPGELSCPMISDVDNHVHIVVCDVGSMSVQVCDVGSGGGEEGWHILTLPELEGQPIAAVVGTDGHTLWVATWHSDQIIKYKI